MAKTQQAVTPVDPVWDRITREAEEAVATQPLMGGLIHACILHHKSLQKALSYRIAAKLSSNEMSMVILRENWSMMPMPPALSWWKRRVRT